MITFRFTEESSTLVDHCTIHLPQGETEMDVNKYVLFMFMADQREIICLKSLPYTFLNFLPYLLKLVIHTCKYTPPVVLTICAYI